MTSTRDLAEAIDMSVALSNRLLDRGGPRGQPASALRRSVAAFQANLETGYRQETLGVILSSLFTAALAAGTAATVFRSVRLAAADMTAVGDLAAWTRRSWRRQALVAEARRYGSIRFTNREEVERARARLTLAFDEMIEDASDVQEFEVMRSFTALFTAVQRHLATTAIPLPRLITYSAPAPQPSLVLAHRLYTDPSRRSELINENSVVHPLFMPTSGRALAT